MQFIDSTNKALQCATGQSIALPYTALDFTTVYVVNTQATGVERGPKCVTGYLDNTFRNLLPSPTSDYTEHDVKSIHVINTDSITHTLTFRVVDSGNARVIFKCTLQPNYSVAYYNEEGWKIFSSDGTIITSLGFATSPTLINPNVGTQSPFNNSDLAASTAYVDRHFSRTLDHNFTPTSGTNTTNEEVLHYLYTGSGAVTTGDLIKVYAKFVVNNSAGTKTFRLWVNSVNNLTGSPVQIAQFTQLTTTIWNGVERHFPVLSNTTIRATAGATVPMNGEWSTNSVTPNTITVPSLTAGVYFLLTGQKSNGADTDTCDSSWLKLER